MEEETMVAEAKETLGSIPTTRRSPENELLLNPDPSINPVFQKVAGRNLNQGGGIEMIMRNQVLNFYGAVETHEPILTASENRAKQDEEREIVIAIEKAKLAAIRAENFKSPTDVLTADAAGIRSKKDVAAPPSELKAEVMETRPPETPKSPQKKKRRPVVEEPKVEKIVDKGPAPFISLWEKYAEEGPPEVEVESESAPPRPPYEFKGPKMFNALSQVRPRDITKVTEGPDGLELIKNASKYKIITPSPKRMDVSTMVRPRENAEADRSLFKNAYTQVRPRGYRELDLGADDDAYQSEEKTMQVSDLDIERSLAASQGLRLRDGNVLWPTILEFTSEIAEIKIKTYIRCFWKIGTDWMFDVRFIQSHTTNYRKQIIYEVVFSKPTNEFPVPPATASVFFIFESEHYSCPDQTMKVQYVLEGNRFPYKPGTVEFREDWLSGIIEDKLRIQTAIHF